MILIFIVVILLISILLSYGKSDLLKKCYIIFTLILSIGGIIGMLSTRPLLVMSLNKRENLDSKFVSWIFEKYDLYAVISNIATIIVVIILVLLLFFNRKNKSGVIWSGTSLVVISVMIINFFTIIVYGYGTINKLFDLASYLLMLSISQIFLLYIPLVCKRLLCYKEG